MIAQSSRFIPSTYLVSVCFTCPSSAPTLTHPFPPLPHPPYTPLLLYPPGLYCALEVDEYGRFLRKARTTPAAPIDGDVQWDQVRSCVCVCVCLCVCVHACVEFHRCTLLSLTHSCHVLGL